MGSLDRLNKVIRKSFPADKDRVDSDLTWYRKFMEKSQVDWEGQAAFFRRVLKASLKFRHERT